MTAELGFSRRYPVGDYRATFSCPLPREGLTLMLTCEWEPDVPARLSASELRAYRLARERFVSELASAVGATSAVIEVGSQRGER